MLKLEQALFSQYNVWIKEAKGRHVIVLLTSTECWAVGSKWRCAEAPSHPEEQIKVV